MEGDTRNHLEDINIQNQQLQITVNEYQSENDELLRKVSYLEDE